MANDKQGLEQIKRDPVNEVQKINLGWKGYVPGYKNKVTRQLNQSIGEQVSMAPLEKLPDGPIRTASEKVDFAETEEDYADQLALQQENYQTEQQLIDFHNEGIKYSHPSYAKYGIVSLLGLITESTDFLDLIGIGVVVSKPSALFFTFIIFLIFWLTNTRQKRADDYVGKAEELVETVTANLAHIERRAFQAAKIARRFGAKRFAARIRISSRLVRRNPLFKFVAAGTANLIPFIAVFPWVLLGIYLSYRDEKKSYQNARETATEIADQIPELNSV